MRFILFIFDALVLLAVTISLYFAYKKGREDAKKGKKK